MAQAHREEEESGIKYRLPYLCTECGKEFSTERFAEKHARIQHDAN